MFRAYEIYLVKEVDFVLFKLIDERIRGELHMARNICRRFLLHNDFVPPAKNIHEWDYLAFGYIDGITVKQNIFKSDGRDLHLIWKESVSAQEELLKPESRQVIYGFRSEEEQEENAEEAFWEDKGERTEYPFVFFVMIQFEDAGRKKLPALMCNRKEVEAKYRREGRVKGITYLTLEDSDLLLVLRSKNYDEGAEIINQIHCGTPFFTVQNSEWNVKYSFTIPGIDKGFMNRGGGIGLKNQKVHHAYIYATEAYSGSIDGLYAQLEDKLQSGVCGRQAVLGYNDELILLSDVPWDEFLDLYKGNTGILNHSSAEFQKYVSSLTTIIGFEQKEQENRTYPKGGEIGDDKKESALSFFFDSLRNKLDEIGKCDFTNEVFKNIFLSLHYLVNSLSKFQNSRTSENLFFPSAFSISVLIEILLEMFKREGAAVSLTCYQDYTRFLKGLHSYAQNPARSDRQFTQAIEYNVRIYNLPVKLNAFYNAFIFCIRNFLNKSSEHETYQYEFLTCPGVSFNMNVEELFVGQSENKRLFLVNIPENQAYHLELMMIMLCHEIGHFVGSDIRQRGERKECLVSALARMITLFYRSSISDLADETFDEFWQSFEEKFSNEIKERYEYYYDEKYIKKNTLAISMSDEKCEEEIKIIAEDRRRLRNHSLVMEDALLDAVVTLIREKQDIFFCEGLYEHYMTDYRKYWDKTYAEKSRGSLQKNIYGYSQDILRVRAGHRNIVNMETMISILIDVCKEGLSDIIAIMTLELSQKQYVMTLIENAYEQGAGEKLTDTEVTEVTIRASLVMACMCGQKKEEKLGYGWNSDWTISEDEDERFGVLYNKVTKFIEEYLNGDSSKVWKRGHDNTAICDYLCDNKLLRSVLRYLLVCRKAYAEIIEQKKSEQKDIRDIFKLANFNTVDSFMLEVQGVIEKYQEEIYKKMEQAEENQ